MFKNSFKIAWRNLIKDKQFSFLNIVGLSTGLACVLLIYLWVHDEWGVDKFNAKNSRLYQVIKNSPNADGTIYTHESTQGLLAKSMAAELPEVEYAVAARQEDIGVVSSINKKIKAKPEFVDKDFFKIFSYKVLEGNKSNPLEDEFGVLVSDNLALKLFNTTADVIGKTITWNGGGKFDGTYKITGVFKAPPSNATDQFDFLFTYDFYATKKSKDLASWGSNGENTYLLLKKGTDIDAFNKKIKNFTKEKIKQLYPGNKDMLRWEGDIFVQRYSDKYLYNHYDNGVISGGRIEYVKLFSIIAIFILLIACVNFMNLSTAKASRRIKEVGIKKVAGASRRSLIFQYLGESMLMAFSSLIMALLLAALLLPAFNEVAGKTISLQLNSNLILSTITITFITGLIAGSYPALYLSGFKPALILKGKLNTSSGESWIRKGLVVFQFSISIILVVAVIVVYKQMKLIQTTNLGYNKDNIISFPNDGSLKKNLSPFLEEIKKIPGVINVSDANGNFLGSASQSGGGIVWEGKDPNLGIEYYGNAVDYNFFETMGLKMAEGRSFSKDFADSSSVIFNESAIKAMGLKNPIGKTVSLWKQKKQIVGVVKDYHFESLYKKIGPAFLTWSPNNANTLVKIKAGSEQQTIADIKELFNKNNSGVDFNYSFLDDDYNALYASEQRVAVLSKYFAGITILISCLGLFGLAAFTAQKRQKEIGIRKVLGATVRSISRLLAKEFMLLVIIAFVIASPIAWYFMHIWLRGFAYRISIRWWIFVAAGLGALVIALVTVSFQAIKAAIANPVKSLRTE